MAELMDRRRGELLSRGATEDQAAALLAYNTNTFQLPTGNLRLPLRDENFVDSWRTYAEEVRNSGTLRSLERYLVQLRFPIKANISRSSEYISATQFDRLFSQIQEWVGLGLSCPDLCTVDIYPTPAGHIAIITSPLRSDFVLLVQAFGHKNEPVALPPTMGALMVAGYRNWHRVTQVLEQNDSIAANGILANRCSYQDRFILLSKGDYSGVSAHQLGLTAEEWRETSWLIRREHETAHYFTRRVLRSMRNNIFDELLADYCGIVRACGRFRADWFLLFLGLEAYPRYRPGGRLENYRGNSLDDSAFRILQSLVYDAALSVESFDRELRQQAASPMDWPFAILTLSRFYLEELAGVAALSMLLETHRATDASGCNSVRNSGSVDNERDVL